MTKKERFSASEQLADHEFCRRLVRANADRMADVSVDEQHDLVNGVGLVPPAAYVTPLRHTTGEQYSTLVLLRVLRIASAIARMEESAVFVESFPKPRTYEKAGITHDRWMEHHYLSFLSAATGIPDMSLLLVNEVLRLGLPPRACRPDSVTQNRWVRDTPTAAALKAVDRACSDLKPARNTALHRGSPLDLEGLLNSNTLRRLSIISTLRRIDGPNVRDSRVVDKLYQQEMKKLRSHMADRTATVAEHVGELFRHLSPLYDRELTRF